VHLDRQRPGVLDRGVELPPPRFGHGQPRPDDGQARQPGIGEDRVDRRVVAAGDDRARAQDPRRVLRRRLVRRPRLVLATPREPLLALPTGLRAALHVPLPDLVLDELGPGQSGHGEPALAHQQHAPDPGRPRGGRELDRLRLADVRQVERQPRRERRPVGRHPVQAALGSEHDAAVPGREVLDPARPPGRRDQELGHG
jgi:hypothetical protein